MNITQSQKTKKHSISHLTESDLIELHNCLVNKGYTAQKLADKIEAHLNDVYCCKEDEIQDEYGLSVEEYIARILNPKCLDISNTVTEVNGVEGVNESLSSDGGGTVATVNQDSLPLETKFNWYSKSISVFEDEKNTESIVYMKFKNSFHWVSKITKATVKDHVTGRHVKIKDLEDTGFYGDPILNTVISVDDANLRDSIENYFKGTSA